VQGEYPDESPGLAAHGFVRRNGSAEIAAGMADGSFHAAPQASMSKPCASTARKARVNPAKAA